MNKLVYLFELDSVRKLPHEINLGQKAMYDEIVVKGNTVVLTFNQLTDSQAFLCALEDEKRHSQIIELFKLGKIKISLFGKYRTASQYIINAIEKCIENLQQATKQNGTSRNKVLNKDDHSFIFSSWPIDPTDQSLMENIVKSLKYNDLNLLNELLEKQKQLCNENAVTYSQKIKDLEKIISYVKLIIHIDMYEIPYIPARQEKLTTLSQYIDLVLDHYHIAKSPLGEYSNIKLSKASIQAFRSALIKISQLKQSFLAQKNTKLYNINSRSDWYNKIKEESADNEIKYMEKVIVDMCHNYTTESSINGIAKRFIRIDSVEFWEDFEMHFARYLQTHSIDIHAHKIKIPNWAPAVRFSAWNPKQYTSTSKKHPYRTTQNNTIYSSDRLHQCFILIIKSLIRFVSLFTYIAIAVIITFWLNILEEVSLSHGFTSLELKFSIWCLPISIPWDKIIAILLFGVLSSLVGKLPFVHDLFDCFLDFLKLILNDWIYYWKYLIFSINYEHKFKKIKKRGKIFMRSSLKKYFNLIKERPGLFMNSDKLQIEYDVKKIKTFMKQTKKKIGVVYESPYHILLVDLIKDEKTNGYYTYERIVSTQKGGVVIIPKHGENFILLNQFRHSMRNYQYAFPRGFGEPQMSAEENAKKEICEELGLTNKDITDITFLGTIIADSGLCGDTVSVFICDIEANQIPIPKGYEGIETYIEKTPTEFGDMVKKWKSLMGSH